MKMKKSTLLAMALLAQLNVLAGNNTGGDTIVVEKPQKVTIVTTDSLQHILVEGKENNPDYTYSNTLQIVDSNYVSTSSINKGDFTIGFKWPYQQERANSAAYTFDVVTHWAMGYVNGPGMPKPADLNMGNSAELWFILDTEWRPWKNRHVFSLGVGADWRNYRMEGNFRFMKDAEDRNVIGKLPEGAEPKFSRVKVFSLNFPFRYHYRTKHFGFSLGPVININSYASVKTRYKLNGNKYKEKEKNIHPTPITLDFMGTITTPIVNFYVKYSPCNVLQADYGLTFRSFSIGVIF